MKKLNNIVVESLNKEHGEEIIRAFRDLGINTMNKQGFCCKLDGDIDRYYGLFNGVFSNEKIQGVRQFECKIITIEQLKAMKEDKSEYPKLMYVADRVDNLGFKDVREVFCKEGNGYWAYHNADKNQAYYWKYAQDIEEAPDPKQEEKPKVEFTGSLCMGDFREKTMTFIIDGDIELNPGRYLITKID